MYEKSAVSLFYYCTFLPQLRPEPIVVLSKIIQTVAAGQFIGYVIFIIIIGWVAYSGLDQIKWVQNIGSPILIVVMIPLLMYFGVSGPFFTFVNSINYVWSFVLGFVVYAILMKTSMAGKSYVTEEDHEAFTERA